MIASPVYSESKNQY